MARAGKSTALSTGSPAGLRPRVILCVSRPQIIYEGEALMAKGKVQGTTGGKTKGSSGQKGSTGSANKGPAKYASTTGTRMERPVRENTNSRDDET